MHKPDEVLPVYADSGLFSFKGRFIILYGGRSGGRSHVAIQWFYYNMATSDYFRGYLMRLNHDQIRESLWRNLNDYIIDNDQSDYVHMSQSNVGSMYGKHLETGNEVLTKGFRTSTKKNVNSLKGIEGATHVLIEEFDEIEEDEFDKLDESLRTVKGPIQVMMMLNTENPEHWVWERFFDGVDENSYPIPKDDPNVLTVFSNYLYNQKYTAQSTIDKYNSYIGRRQRRYDVVVLGKLLQASEGRIYTNIKLIDEMPTGLQGGYGIDFGFTNDPTAVVHCILHNDNLYLDELVYATGMTNQRIATTLIDLGVTRNDEVIADSAEPKSIAELNAAGLNVKSALKGPDSVRQGIDVMLGLTLHITKRSTNLRKETQHYVWAMGVDGRPTNKPIDDWNHALDAGRYYTQTKKMKPKMTIKYTPVTR